MLKRLKLRYKLGIVTNGNRQKQQNKIRLSGLKPLFESIIISGQVGIRKPQRGIFEHALQNIKSTPEQTLFIGDSLENDMAGAANVGMKTCWVSQYLLPNETVVKPDYCIASILDVNSLL